MSIKFEQTTQQRLVLAPNMTLALNILRMANLELQAYLQTQTEINPLLEVEESNPEESLSESANETDSPAGDDPWDDWHNSWGNGSERESSDEQSRSRREILEQSMARPISLHESLDVQLGCQRLGERERLLGEFIIHHLDEHGYLESSIEELTADINAGAEELENALRLVQTFDPPGVGARDLQECLQIQLRILDQSDSLAYKIVTDHFPMFAQRRYRALAKALKVNITEAEEACEIIRNLNPKPGRMFTADLPHNIVPDLVIHKRDDYYDVELTDQRVPYVGINRYYYRMMRNPQTPTDVKDFLHNKFRQASWVIKAIDERNSTLLSIARCLISLQREFFDHGPATLKPLTQSKVAGLVGRHPSTVSRAIAGKTIDTPFGVMRLEEFFASAVPQEETASLSDAKIKSELVKLIEQENPDKPLSDEALCRQLREKNFSVARRTIAKYRTAMKILPAHMRRKRRDS